MKEMKESDLGISGRMFQTEGWFYKYKRPEGRVCLACWRNHKEPSVSGKVYVRWGWGSWKILLESRASALTL